MYYPKCEIPWYLPQTGHDAPAMPSACSAQVNKLINAAIPLGHMGRRWDIAMACLFLARLAAGYGGGMRAALCVAGPTDMAHVVATCPAAV